MVATDPAWVEGWCPQARRCVSPNQDERTPGMPIELVVLHSISLPPGEYGGDAIERLFTNCLDARAHPSFAELQSLHVSAHFLVRRDGELVQFVSADRRAWHAGVSNWDGRDRCNDWSIGIELEGLEGRSFEVVQYVVLARLLRALRRRYPLSAVVGHEHVAPTRKRDPGTGFDWVDLQRRLRWRAALFPATT
jgi:AmpD protein